jgi:hypothetical protein
LGQTHQPRRIYPYAYKYAIHRDKGLIVYMGTDIPSIPIYT